MMKSPEKGFVLMYVLGMLVVLATLVTGASIASRQRLLAVAATRDLTQAQLALKGAMQAVVAKISLDKELAKKIPQQNQPGLKDIKIPDVWVPDGYSRSVALDGHAFDVLIQRAEWAPDANLLAEPEWFRLMQSVGVSDGAASLFAARLVQKRILLQTLGAGGFSNYHAILDSLPFTPSVLFGSHTKNQSGLIDLFAIGTGSRVTDPMQTRWQVYKGLYNADDRQIQRLLARRSSGQMTKAEESEIFGVPVETPTKPPAGSSGEKLKVTVSFASPHPSSSIALVGQVNVSATPVSLQTQYLYFRE